jgi:hypothetical protein
MLWANSRNRSLLDEELDAEDELPGVVGVEEVMYGGRELDELLPGYPLELGPL